MPYKKVIDRFYLPDIPFCLPDPEAKQVRLLNHGWMHFKSLSNTRMMARCVCGRFREISTYNYVQGLSTSCRCGGRYINPIVSDLIYAFDREAYGLACPHYSKKGHEPLALGPYYLMTGAMLSEQGPSKGLLKLWNLRHVVHVSDLYIVEPEGYSILQTLRKAFVTFKEAKAYQSRVEGRLFILPNPRTLWEAQSLLESNEGCIEW